MKIASSLLAGGVNVALGGGELGRGFYSGEHLYVAKAWAYQRFGDRVGNVVHFDVSDTRILSLKIKFLDYEKAIRQRYSIKRNKKTRSYIFNVDMVWAPIVGSERASGDQYKWESLASQSLLNAPMTIKKIV